MKPWQILKKERKLDELRIKNKQTNQRHICWPAWWHSGTSDPPSSTVLLECRAAFQTHCQACRPGVESKDNLLSRHSLSVSARSPQSAALKHPHRCWASHTGLKQRNTTDFHTVQRPERRVPENTRRWWMELVSLTSFLRVSAGMSWIGSLIRHRERIDIPKQLGR